MINGETNVTSILKNINVDVLNFDLRKFNLLKSANTNRITLYKSTSNLYKLKTID